MKLATTLACFAVVLFIWNSCSIATSNVEVATGTVINEVSDSPSTDQFTIISKSRTVAFSNVSAFLNALSSTQYQKTVLPFDDLSRENWHFLPGAMWPRVGIRLHELAEPQKKLLFDLLRSSLSETGYEKTQKIIELESVLAEMSGDKNFRDPEKYNVAFYGNPVKDSLWAWSFEGHHISLNFTIKNDEMAIVPRFLGASPAVIKEGKRKGERTLAKEQDLGMDLVNSLSAKQRQKAIFKKRAYREIVTANATEVAPLEPVGIFVQELELPQQKTLMSLINEYLITMPIQLAQKRMKNLEQEEMSEIRFGWAGATEIGKPHYYRIQGKTFLIEFDNTQGNANHIHTVWRDFDGDFGKDLIREHYKTSNHD